MRKLTLPALRIRGLSLYLKKQIETFKENLGPYLQEAKPVIKRGMNRGITTLMRERQWTTALGALFGVFLLVQLLVLVLLGIESVQSILKNRTDLRVEIRSTASDHDIQTFYTGLLSLPYVRDVSYITKQKAYEITRQKDPDLISFLEEFHIENPFSDTVGVTLESLDSYEEFTAFIEQSEWSHVIDPTFLSEFSDQKEHVSALLNITEAGRMLTMIIIGLTGLALLFIISELTRRRALDRSDEVLVERLVGATPLSIFIPFLTEAVVLCLTAIALSGILMLLIMFFMPLIIPALRASGGLYALRQEMIPLFWGMLPVLLFLECIITPTIAGVGAWFGIRPQIKSPRITFAV